MTNHLFCACCGDEVKAIYLCKFVYHDNLIVDLNVCLDCMDTGTLKIDLKRRRHVGSILKRIVRFNMWKKRTEGNK